MTFFYNKLEDNIKKAIIENDPIDNILHVIMVVSNPCLYKKRYKLSNEFKERMLKERNIELYIVELTYKDQEYVITERDNKNHLRINAETPLWHKENMINLGIRKLLPSNWKAVAWIDADIEFENADWALDTLKVLNGCRDIVQIYSHCVDMDNNENTIQIYSSAGYQYSKSKKYSSAGNDYWHPGFAWAITREGYEKIGEIYENSILGSGDNIILFSLFNNGLKAVLDSSSEDYKADILNYQKKIKMLRFGYIPGLIRHYFHGSKKNRKYKERWEILSKYDFSPYVHIKKDENGIIIPTNEFSEEFKNDILGYFQERNEDDEEIEVRNVDTKIIEKPKKLNVTSDNIIDVIHNENMISILKDKVKNKYVLFLDKTLFT